MLLEQRTQAAGWVVAGEGVTDQDGRVSQLLKSGAVLEAAIYRLTFRTGDYFESQECFYPQVTVHFHVHDTSAHYHIPVLLSPYGYITYRGS